ncbi:unnamed protein product [Aphanomyces euteiches]|uniref:Phenazine biosynthesis protein PhzF n=1 Tax=Aphanomyces euteiches TaxID=100861 RepID=A0A6G0WJ30_9STRA|nr:hypothetical protein Ae201684_014738 [Aphanomyces euteiches]KAH9078720.1 hypothetical protein Ae201684P_019794 [Aphanomyces euteiches]KAH9157990.1 hypothetical protein AeRB84_000228 [Aphanomyces euteiches]
MAARFTVHHYDSLLATRGAPGGNKAGIVHLDGGFPSDQVMQTVAKIVGFSETAFFTKDDKKVHIQFFTPEGEVDLCGHATVAAFSALERDSTFEMHTKKSILTVATDSTGRVTMDQDLPSFEEPKPNVIPSVLEALGLTIDDVCFDEIPLTIVSTGLPDLFVAVKSREVLNQILRPDVEKIAAISKRLTTIGFHVFTLDVDEGFTAECRNFAPLYGIDEEAATGTSSGALGSLLCHVAKDFTTFTRHMVFLQGSAMQLPSRIESTVSIENGSIVRVSIAGIAEPCGSQEVEVTS